MKEIANLKVASDKKIPNYTYPLYQVTGSGDFVIPDELYTILKAIVENDFYVHTNPEVPELKIKCRGLIISKNGIFILRKKDRYDPCIVCIKDGIPYIELYKFQVDDGFISGLYNNSLLLTSDLDPETMNNTFYELNHYQIRTDIASPFNIQAFIKFPLSLEADGYYF